MNLAGRVWNKARRIVVEKWLASRVNCEGPGAGIRLSDPIVPVRIRLARGASITLRGTLRVDSFCEGREPAVFGLGRNSALVIDGDFTIGNGTRIVLGDGAQVHIGGRRQESVSGITEKSLIMARKRITIGADFICAWNVFITDCDWHCQPGRPFQEDTVIGDHVWIAPNCSILKGSSIGNGCLIATGSVVHRCALPENTLCGGNPCKVLATNRTWTGDMPADAARA